MGPLNCRPEEKWSVIDIDRCLMLFSCKFGLSTRWGHFLAVYDPVIKDPRLSGQLGSEAPVTISAGLLQPLGTPPRLGRCRQHRCHSPSISHHRWEAGALPLLTWELRRGSGTNSGTADFCTTEAARAIYHLYDYVKTAAVAFQLFCFKNDSFWRIKTTWWCCPKLDFLESPRQFRHSAMKVSTLVVRMYKMHAFCRTCSSKNAF